MKKIFQFALLALLSIAPCYATQVDIKLKHKIHNGTKGGARMPALLPSISVDFTDGIVTSSITHYIGTAYVYVCDIDGNIVAEQYENISDSSTSVMSLEWLTDGEYTIHYIMNNLHFEGELQV